MSIMPEDDLIGRRVRIYTAWDESEEGTVIKEIGNGMLKVQTDDGEILIGNTWDDL